MLINYDKSFGDFTNSNGKLIVDLELCIKTSLMLGDAVNFEIIESVPEYPVINSYGDWLSSLPTDEVEVLLSLHGSLTRAYEIERDKDA